MSTTKKIYIKNSQGERTESNIGAEAQYVDVSRDNLGNVVNKHDFGTISIPLNQFLQKINQAGAKNLIKCILPKGTTYKLGDNFTGIINNDFSISVNGNAPSSYFLITNEGTSIFQSFLPKGEYNLSGCPEGGSEDTYYLSIDVEGQGEILNCKDIGEGSKFELTQDSYIKIIGYCNTNYSLTNLVFKPMITLKDEINNYNSYQEPSMTNEQLTREMNDMMVKGAVPINRGGTGATNAVTARNNLGLGGIASDGSGPLKPQAGGTGVNSLEELRSILGFGNTSSTEPLGVNYGGTGLKQSPTLLVDLESTNSDPILKANPRPGVTGILPKTRGGTGSSTGNMTGVSINGVTLATQNGKYGYMDGSTFKSFRQPTGNATAAQVLSGYTFANASSDAISGTLSFSGNAETSHVLSGKTFYKNSTSKLTGTMANYSGSSRRTVTPSGGTGNEQLSLPAGYHDSVIVNRTNVYNTGYDAGGLAQRKVQWTENFLCVVPAGQLISTFFSTMDIISIQNKTTQNISYVTRHGDPLNPGQTLRSGTLAQNEILTFQSNIHEESVNIIFDNTRYASTIYYILGITRVCYKRF